MAAKKVIYTAIFGNKDDLKPITKHKGYDYIVFTDNKHLASDDFEIVFCPSKYEDPTRNARQCKVLAHKFLPGYCYSLWIDASIQIDKVDLDKLFESYLKNHDIALHKHPIRDCLYDEADRCIEIGKDNSLLIERQMEKYRAENYPLHNGLASTGILYRRHTPLTADFNNYWWQEIERHSRRDQLSFNYVAWKHGIDFYTIDTHVRNQNVQGFSIAAHKEMSDYKNW